MIKWLINCVLPGLDEVLASFVRPVIIFMREDFPTFDRPMKAYSGSVGAGQFSTFGLLIKYFAERISIGKL